MIAVRPMGSLRESILAKARELPFLSWTVAMAAVVRDHDDNYYVERMTEHATKQAKSNIVDQRWLAKSAAIEATSNSSKQPSAPRLANTFISSAPVSPFPFKEGGEQPSPIVWEVYFQDIEIACNMIGQDSYFKEI